MRSLTVLVVIGNLFFFLTNKETAKAECVITSLNNFICSGCHSYKNIILNILKFRRLKFVKFGAMMSVCIYFTVTFFVEINQQYFFIQIFNTRLVSQGIPSFAHDYLQTGYSYVLSISYLFINNTLKCIKAKIFPFNQK